MQTPSIITTDHNEIKRWVEQRNGRPIKAYSPVKNDRDPKLIRIQFPQYHNGERYEELSWEDFFENFEKYNMAFLYQEKRSTGDLSYFNRLISRIQLGEPASDDHMDTSGSRPGKTIEMNPDAGSAAA